jgi:hypothetical protein
LKEKSRVKINSSKFLGKADFIIIWAEVSTDSVIITAELYNNLGDNSLGFLPTE